MQGASGRPAPYSPYSHSSMQGGTGFSVSPTGAAPEPQETVTNVEPYYGPNIMGPNSYNMQPPAAPARSWGDMYNSGISYAKQAASEMADTVQNNIREHPLQALMSMEHGYSPNNRYGTGGSGTEGNSGNWNDPRGGYSGPVSQSAGTQSVPTVAPKPGITSVPGAYSWQQSMYQDPYAPQYNFGWFAK